MTAGVSQVLSPISHMAEEAGGVAAGYVAHVLVGGTVSAISGGKFANGAMSASVEWAFGQIGKGVTDGGAEWTDEVEASAQAAKAAYNSLDGGLLSSLGINYRPTHGFRAELTLGEDGRYILAFAGTHMSSLANWGANLKQAMGFQTSQYEQAVSLAKAVSLKVSGNVMFVGHSLGGGLAAAASYATGRNAITFNAAGLHSRYKQGTPGEIRNHFIRGEVLTMVQALTPLPNAAGRQIGHSAPWSHSPLRRHFMAGFP